MSVSQKYRTFNQLLEDVTIDFSAYSLEGHVEPQQLIKVAQRVNYDLGLRIHRSREQVLDIEHSKSALPTDFKYLNYAFVCNNWKVNNTPPSGTTVDTTQTKYFLLLMIQVLAEILHVKMFVLLKHVKVQIKRVNIQ